MDLSDLVLSLPLYTNKIKMSIRIVVLFDWATYHILANYTHVSKCNIEHL